MSFEFCQTEAWRLVAAADSVPSVDMIIKLLGCQSRTRFIVTVADGGIAERTHFWMWAVTMAH